LVGGGRSGADWEARIWRGWSWACWSHPTTIEGKPTYRPDPKSLEAFILENRTLFGADADVTAHV
jgi:hypothetical protein